MKVIVIGSKDWTNYDEVVRNMTVLVYDWFNSNPTDKTLTILHTGAWGAESMVTQYIDRVRKLFKQNGYFIKDRVYNLRKYPESITAADRDKDMVENGEAEKALIFIKGACKRSTGFARLADAYGIETKIIRE